MNKLNNLPASDDEYFTEVKADTNKQPRHQDKECKHHFRHEKANWVRCENCGVGFKINHKDTIKEGHIYRDDTLIV